MKNFLSTGILIILSNLVFCQNQHDFISDSLRYLQTYDSVTYYMHRDVDKAQQFATKNLNYAKASGNTKWIARSTGNYGTVLSEIGGIENWSLAEQYLLDSKKMFIELKDSTSIVFVNNVLSSIYGKTKQYPKAIQLAKYNVKIIKSNVNNKADSLTLGISYGNLGIIYKDLELYDSAIANYNKGKIIFDMLNHEFMHTVTFNIGECYQKQEKWEQAIANYKMVAEANKKLNLTLDQSLLYTNLAKCYFQLELNDKALQYGKQALTMVENNKQSAYYLLALTSLPKYFLKLGNIDSASYYVDKALVDLKQTKIPEYTSEALKVKAEIFETKGDSSKAFKYYKKAQFIDDSLEQVKNLPRTTEILLSEENKEQAEIKSNFQKTIKKRNNWIWVLIIGIIGILGLVYFVFSKYRSKFTFLQKKEERLFSKLKEVEVEKDQINRQMVTTKANLVLKNDLLSKLDDVLNKIKVSDLSALDKLDLKQAHASIKDNLELHTTWQDFFKHFEEVEPNFIKILSTEYGLSQNDLKLCAFIKMNLSSKEMSKILNVRLNSVHVGVHRIKKKLELEENMSVFDFLHSEKFQ